VVAHVLRLRLALLLGALRGDRRHIIRAVAGVLVVILLTAAGCWGLTVAAEESVADLRIVLIGGGVSLFLAFLLAGVLTGGEDPVDPRRFVVFGLREVTLTGALVLAGLVSVPVFALAALAITAAVLGGDAGASVPGVVTAALVSILTCALAARVGFASIAVLAPRRRRTLRRGVALLALLAVVIPAAFGVVTITGWGGTRLADVLGDVTDVLALAPGGASWAVLAPDGGAGEALAWTVAIATLVALGGVFFALAIRLQRHTPAASAQRDRGRLGWFALMPGTPGGAIAARSMLYWLHDRRYLTNVVIVPIAAVIVVVPLLVAGVPLGTAILLPVPLVALFLGWLPHDDVAYDSTAVWMHVAAGVPGVSDRVGRLAPLLLLGTPFLAVAVPLAVAVNGDWTLLPALAGVCAGLFFSGLGLSSISSVISPYAVTRPGDSPFRQPQRTGSSGLIAQGGVFIGALGASAPALWLAWLTLTRSSEYAIWALMSGIAAGAIVLIAGVSIGSLVFGRRGGRLLEFAETA
jgi:ABC-2 type transport system permease protein